MTIVGSILERKVFRILNVYESDVLLGRRCKVIEIEFKRFCNIKTRIEFEKHMRKIIKEEMEVEDIFLKYSRWANKDIYDIIKKNN